MTTPKTQSDSRVRMVGLANLAAMCEYVSGVCHRFTMDEPSKSARFVRVTYSNPDEYGSDRPVTALYPLVRDCHGKGEHTALLMIHSVINASDSEDWQAFGAVEDCASLWRDPVSGEWKESKVPK